MDRLFSTIITHSSEFNKKTRLLFQLPQNITIHFFNLYGMAIDQFNGLIFTTFFKDIINFLILQEKFRKENTLNYNHILRKDIDNFLKIIQVKLKYYLVNTKHIQENQLDFVDNEKTYDKEPLLTNLNNNIIDSKNIDYNSSTKSNQQYFNNFKKYITLFEGLLNQYSIDELINNVFIKELKKLLENNYFYQWNEVLMDYYLTVGDGTLPRGIFIYQDTNVIDYLSFQNYQGIYLSKVISIINEYIQNKYGDLKQVDILLLSCRSDNIESLRVKNREDYEKYRKIYSITNTIDNLTWVFNEFNLKVKNKFVFNQDLFNKLFLNKTIENRIKFVISYSYDLINILENKTLSIINNIHLHPYEKPLNYIQIEQIKSQRYKEYYFNSDIMQNENVFYIEDNQGNIISSLSIYISNTINGEKICSIWNVVTNQLVQNNNYSSILLFYTIIYVLKLNPNIKIFISVMFDSPLYAFNRMKLYNSLGFFICDKGFPKYPNDNIVKKINNSSISKKTIDTYEYMQNINYLNGNIIDKNSIYGYLENNIITNSNKLYSVDTYEIYNDLPTNVDCFDYFKFNNSIKFLKGESMTTNEEIYYPVYYDSGNDRINYIMALNNDYFNVLGDVVNLVTQKIKPSYNFVGGALNEKNKKKSILNNKNKKNKKTIKKSNKKKNKKTIKK